jgi:hypothetical protein
MPLERSVHMLKIDKAYLATMLLAGGLLGLMCVSAAVRIAGQVQAGGGPLASSTVTLWAASAGQTTGSNKIRQ